MTWVNHPSDRGDHRKSYKHCTTTTRAWCLEPIVEKSFSLSWSATRKVTFWSELLTENLAPLSRFLWHLGFWNQKIWDSDNLQADSQAIFRAILVTEADSPVEILQSRFSAQILRKSGICPVGESAWEKIWILDLESACAPALGWSAWDLNLFEGWWGFVSVMQLGCTSKESLY